MSDKSGLYVVLAVSLVAVLGLAFAFISPSDTNIVGDVITYDAKLIEAQSDLKITDGIMINELDSSSTCVQCNGREPVFISRNDFNNNYPVGPLGKNAATICLEMGHAGCLLAYQGEVRRIFEDGPSCEGIESEDYRTLFVACDTKLSIDDTACSRRPVSGGGYRPQSTERYIQGIVCLG